MSPGVPMKPIQSFKFQNTTKKMLANFFGENSYFFFTIKRNAINQISKQCHFWFQILVYQRTFKLVKFFNKSKNLLIKTFNRQIIYSDQ